MLQASAGEASCVEYKMHQLSIYCPKVIRSFQDVLAMLKAEEVFRCTMEGRVIYEKVILFIILINLNEVKLYIYIYIYIIYNMV